jgi:rubrerythrin
VDYQLESLVMPLGYKPRADDVSAIERLQASLENHVTEEGKFLKIYAEAAEKHDSPLVKFILKLIMADEETHHGVLRRVASALEADLRWRNDGNDIPRLGKMDAAEIKRLRDLTDAFIDEEKHGIDQCKSLMKMSEKCYGGLLTMLLGTIIHDSQKHVIMLRFIRKQLK